MIMDKVNIWERNIFSSIPKLYPSLHLKKSWKSGQYGLNTTFPKKRVSFDRNFIMKIYSNELNES